MKTRLNARRRLVTVLLICLAAILMGTSPFDTLEENAFSPRSEDLRSIDYADGVVFRDHWWRGYAFEVSEVTTITHLIGGTSANCATGFHGAIYQAHWEESSGQGFPRIGALLGSVRFDPRKALGVRSTHFDGERVALSSPVVLRPGETYFLAQGRTGPTGFVCHFGAERLDRGGLISQNTFLSSWYPERGSYQVQGTWSGEELEGKQIQERSDTEVLVGFTRQVRVLPVARTN